MFGAINELMPTFQVDSSNVATARTLPFFKMPRAGTIVAAHAVSESGIVTAQSVTSFLALSLIAGGAVGTSTLTIATFGSAATPYTWTANQGYQATVDTTTNKDLASGAWVMVREEGTSTRTTGVLGVCVHVVLGTGRVS